MSILKMKKVTIGGIKNEKDDILYLLQRMGVMEITDVIEDDDEDKQEREPNPKLNVLRKEISDIEEALSQIKPFVKKKGMAKPEFSLDEMNKAGEDEGRLATILEKIQVAEDSKNDIKVKINSLEKTVATLSPLKELNVPLDSIGKSLTTTSMVGTVPNRSAGLIKDIKDCDNFHFELLMSDRENTYVFFVSCNEGFEEAVNQLRILGFTGLDMSSYKGLAAEIIKSSEKEISSLQDELTKASAVYEELSSDYDFLMLNADYLSIELQRLLSLEKSNETIYTFFVEGWVCERDVAPLRKAVTDLSPNCFMEDRDPLDDETIPTALKNNSIVKPYEAVTDLYSPPDARGIDPNSVMAPFFFIFVGMMVSDAGYGILLAIASFIALKVMKPGEGMMGKIIKVVVMAGISTAIWGALFGSWFAITPTNTSLYWFVPMQEPLLMLTICYSLGVVHLFVGHFVAMYMGFRDGDWQAAIFDNFMWLALYTGLLMMLVAGAGPMLFNASMPGWLSQYGGYVAIAGAAGLVLTQGRAKKGIISKFISGVLSLYNISGFLSDVLSYSRLFALGLATGVVGMVINTIVGMTMGSILMPLGIIVFVGGHIFNICLNILGAYVHSSRLQYIEYFSKFYADGGTVFDPLRLKTKHVKIS